MDVLLRHIPCMLLMPQMALQKGAPPSNLLTCISYKGSSPHAVLPAKAEGWHIPFHANDG